MRIPLNPLTMALIDVELDCPAKMTFLTGQSILHILVNIDFVEEASRRVKKLSDPFEVATKILWNRHMCDSEIIHMEVDRCGSSSS